MSFKKGDKVQRISYSNSNFNAGMTGTIMEDESVTSGYVNVRVDDSGEISTDNDIRNLILISSNTMTLKDKFAVAFKGEPEKSFIKAGVMNVDESLTSEGQALFMAYLLRKEGAAFKTEVIDPILAEEEKSA